MEDQLHPSPIIEETFGDDSALAGNIPKCSRSRAHVQRRLFGAPAIECALAHQPLDRLRLFCDLSSNVGNFLREFDRASRGFSAPEGNRWGCPVCIFNPDATRFHPANSP